MPMSLSSSSSPHFVGFLFGLLRLRSMRQCRLFPAKYGMGPCFHSLLILNRFHARCKHTIGIQTRRCMIAFDVSVARSHTIFWRILLPFIGVQHFFDCTHFLPQNDAAVAAAEAIIVDFSIRRIDLIDKIRISYSAPDSHRSQAFSFPFAIHILTT